MESVISKLLPERKSDKSTEDMGLQSRICSEPFQKEEQIIYLLNSWEGPTLCFSCLTNQLLSNIDNYKRSQSRMHAACGAHPRLTLCVGPRASLDWDMPEPTHKAMHHMQGSLQDLRCLWCPSWTWHQGHCPWHRVCSTLPDRPCIRTTVCTDSPGPEPVSRAGPAGHCIYFVLHVFPLGYRNCPWHWVKPPHHLQHKACSGGSTCCPWHRGCHRCGLHVAPCQTGPAY